MTVTFRAQAWLVYYLLPMACSFANLFLWKRGKKTKKGVCFSVYLLLCFNLPSFPLDIQIRWNLLMSSYLVMELWAWAWSPPVGLHGATEILLPLRPAHSHKHTPPTRRWWIHVQKHIYTTEECLFLTHVARLGVWQSVRHLSAHVIKWCIASISLSSTGFSDCWVSHKKNGGARNSG